MASSSHHHSTAEQVREECNTQVAMLQAEIQELQQQLQLLGSRVSAEDRTRTEVGEQSRTKPAKPDVFDPSKPNTNVRSWLFSLNNYFQAVGVLPEQFGARKNYAVTLFRGPALEWWRQLVLLEEKRLRPGNVTGFGGVPTIFPGNPDTQALLTHLPTTWTEFEAAVRGRFELINATEVARGKLKWLKQLTSVQEYTRRFLALTAEIDDMSEAEMVDRYRDGLKKELATMLAVYGITNLQQIIATAERIDAVQQRGWQSRRYQERYPTAGDRRPVQNNGPTPMELGAIPSSRGTDRHANNDFERRKFNGQCFNCGKYGHRARDCRQPKNQQPKGGHQ